MSEDRINFENNGDGGVKYTLPSSVSVEELLTNKVGIMQILDKANSQTRLIQKQTEELEKLKCARLSLPVSVYLAIGNLIGTVLVAVGVNLLTSNMLPSISCMLVVSGGLLVISSCLTPIIHPWYAKRENRKR